MEAAGRMQTNVKLFDPKFSSTIASYADKVGDEVADVIDKKYMEFFQAPPTKEDFDAQTVIDKIINDEEYNRYFEELN